MDILTILVVLVLVVVLMPFIGRILEPENYPSRAERERERRADDRRKAFYSTVTEVQRRIVPSWVNEATSQSEYPFEEARAFWDAVAGTRGDARVLGEALQARLTAGAARCRQCAEEYNERTGNPDNRVTQEYGHRATTLEAAAAEVAAIVSEAEGKAEARTQFSHYQG